MPTIALSIAAILLLVVGGMSYRESVRSSLEKEYADKEERLMQRMGQTPAAPGSANPAEAAPAPAPAGRILYDEKGNPVYLTEAGVAPAAAPAPSAVAGREVESSLAPPEDPDIASMRASLEQARQQSRLTDESFNQLAGEAIPAPAAPYEGAPSAGGGATISEELPDFLRNAVNNPPGGNPEIEAQLQRLKSQVTSAPSLAKVTSYDRDWGVVTFDAGAVQGVKVDQRFAVRRGSEILGWVKVDQVEEDQAIAVLVTRNADSETSVKPDVGDDLIDFELY